MPRDTRFWSVVIFKSQSYHDPDVNKRTSSIDSFVCHEYLPTSFYFTQHNSKRLWRQLTATLHCGPPHGVASRQHELIGSHNVHRYQSMVREPIGLVQCVYGLFLRCDIFQSIILHHFDTSCCFCGMAPVAGVSFKLGLGACHMSRTCSVTGRYFSIFSLFLFTK
jgi:hypothetical protein